MLLWEMQSGTGMCVILRLQAYLLASSPALSPPLLQFIAPLSVFHTPALFFRTCFLFKCSPSTAGLGLLYLLSASTYTLLQTTLLAKLAVDSVGFWLTNTAYVLAKAIQRMEWEGNEPGRKFGEELEHYPSRVKWYWSLRLLRRGKDCLWHNIRTLRIALPTAAVARCWLETFT